MQRKRTIYRIHSPKLRERTRLAVAADLHSAPFDDVLPDFSACDAVLVPGDLVDRHRKNNENALLFLKQVPETVPVFYAIGNHERRCRNAEEYLKTAMQSRAVLLDNRSCVFRDILIGGLSSTEDPTPDMGFLDRFEAESGFRLLMCHHPEIYRDFVRNRDIDFTVCGHAHGGQIQICGRGLYAPGQGLLPKLTHGIYDQGKMMVSRGMTNSAKPRIPRIGNPCELVILELEPEEKQGGNRNESGRPETAGGMV